MKIKFVMPQRDYDLVSWLSKATSLEPGTCGIPESEIASVKTLCDDYKAKVVASDEAQALSKIKTAEKQASHKTLESVLRPLFRRIKAHPDYTMALGAQLGIEGSATAYDLNNGFPNLTAIDKTDGTVELRFARRGSDGVRIYYQEDQEPKWKLLGRATTSPFLDVRPLQFPGKPELRRYTAVYMQKDTEIGHYCNDVVIPCTP